MVDITGLNVTSVYKTTGAGGDKGSFQPAPKQGGGTPFPTDQVVQNTPTATESQPAPTNQTQDPAQRIDIFVVRDNVFSLYKLPNGDFFSKIRNLRTGEERIFPSIDSLSYFDAIRGNRGIFVEKRV